MSEKYLVFSNNIKNNSKDSFNKHFKILSPINHPKILINKLYIKCNSSKNNINNNNQNSFKTLKIPKKKSLSIDKISKPNSHKIFIKFKPNNKILINCINEKQSKELIHKESKENLLKFNEHHNKFGIRNNDLSPIINLHRSDNYFNNQYKRAEQHSNSLKINENKDFINEIKRYINDKNKNPSKFFSIKKESKNKPIILLKNDEYKFQKLTFTNLAFKNQENTLNIMDFDNSSKEEEKSDLIQTSEEEENDDNKEKINLENNDISNNNSFYENEDNKLIIKSKFKINQKKKFKDLFHDEKEINNKNKNKIKLKSINNEISKKDNSQNRNRKYRKSMEQNQIFLLNKKIIVSSSISKSGICDEKEKINQDSYLIRENIVADDLNLYGIFDGHGENGHLISQYISEFINDYYSNESNYIDNKDDLSSSKKKVKKIFLEKNEKTIKNCQKDLDSNLNNKINFDISLSGSTSLLLFLTNEALICSNIGDSQCYLFNCSEEDMWTYESLSKIHRPTDEKEKKRILENGGEIHPHFDQDGIFEGPDRIYAKGKEYPGLSLSRTVGDLEGKKIGIISEPEIIFRKIEENSKFIVMGSDGLWDVIKPYDISRMIRPFFIKGDIDGACKLLLKKAEQIWKKNNEERDDITIIVIFIGKPNILFEKEKKSMLNVVKEKENEYSKRNATKNEVPLLLKLD